MVRVGKKSKKQELLHSSSVDASESALETRDELLANRHSSPPSLANGDAEFRDDLPTDMSDNSESDRENCSNGLEEEKCTETHDGKVVLNQVFPFNIDQLFTMIFTNSQFNLEFLAARSITDYVQVPWQPQGGEKCRHIKYTQGLNAGPIGPKEVHISETQIMNKCSKPGRLYSINCTSENSGVPYADCFCVLVHYCFARLSDTHTDLSIRTQIKYKKSVWPLVRTFVDKNAVAAIEDFAKLLEAQLTAESDHAVSVRKTRRRRRHADSSEETTITNSAMFVPRKSISRPPPSRNGWLGVALAVLIAVNAILLYRLYVDRGYTLDVDVLHNRLRTSAFSNGGDSVEWTKALHRQAERHHAEQAAWRASLAQTVALLAQTEKALMELMETLKPSMEEGREAESRPELWEATYQRD